MAGNTFFQFKQFRITQERSAMKVGLDGVLLGAWIDASGAGRILDIGTGTGLIALMMAQKNPYAVIDALEIDPEAFQEAGLNIGQSDWSDRIKLECCDFREFANCSKLNYDLIVCNPPYFANGIKVPVQNRAQARHSDSLPLEVLLSGAANLLGDKGRIALILPIESLPEIEKLAVTNHLFVSRLCRIKPNPQKPIFRILIELHREAGETSTESLMIEFEKHHDYTPEYKELTRDFYLKF